MNEIKKYLDKDISTWAKKHRIGIVSVLVLVLIAIIGMYITYAYYQVSSTKKVIGASVLEIPDLEVKIMAEERDSNGNGLGSYSEYPYIPQAGYQYNSVSSYCINGSTINYQSATHNAEITSAGVDKCYLYFDSIAQLDITINVMAEDVDNNGDGVGTYTKLETTALPSVGYTLSSYTCTNGTTISYSDEENLFTVSASGKDECTVYMDAVNPDISLKLFVQASSGSNTYNEVNKLTGCYTLRTTEQTNNSSCTGTSTLSYVNGRVVISATSKTDCVAYLDISNECSAGELGRALYTKQGANDLYYHNEKLINGAGDKSYRYAGENPNNYICFGSSSSTCPDANLYRIIGMIPVDVVTDETDPNNIVTERQMLYKIIKNDYITASELGIAANSSAIGKYGLYAGPTGNQPTGDVEGFYWNSNGSNTWSTATLNAALNSTATGYYLANLGTSANNIAKVMWKVGGGNDSYVREATPMSVVYTNEITESGIHVTNAPTDGKNEIANKVGLMYVSDYGYAAPQTAWSTAPSSYSSVVADNWMYKGVNEWTVSRTANFTNYVFYVNGPGIVYYNVVGLLALGVRPVLYLTSSTNIDYGHNLGTISNPYRIS